ncbi:nSTAND1 domain-containing NTPase [Streptomyces goshikiensis]|uniref:nSTAND1 domain-containing NTPase n=1 Tax=Streptomyces goshikiensis TaxID=1942 RepID=UPI00378DE582
MRQRMQVVLQSMLVLVASLLGIVTNYATNVDDAPWLLQLIQRASVPAIGLLVAAMVIGQVIAYRLENPPPPHAAWPRDRVPYPGLDAFAEDENAVFFGREAQAAELTRRLHVASAQPGDRFLLLVGASGSGKSSLVRAGVMPRLRERRWTVLPAITPGPDPLGALATAVSAAGSGDEPATILRRLRQDPAALKTELGRIRGGRFRRVLLVIDQFEEVLTLAGEGERAQFLDALLSCVRQDLGIRVLATLRVDFLGRLLDSGHAEIVQHPTVIGAISRGQLAQVVERPGALVDLSFEQGVVDTIVEETGTDDALPLLAYLLQELYFASGPGGTVTQDLYRRLGGVAGALSRQADHTVTGLGPVYEIGFVLRVLLRFVTVQGQEVARRRVPLSELSEEERHVVDAFVDARLLVSDVAGGDAPFGQQPHAHVTHEALFRQWAPLRQEVEAHVEQLRERAELERWAADWEHSGHSDDYLLTGERLRLAQRWLAALEETGQAPEAARALVHSSQRRDLVFLRRISESIGQYALGSVDTHPERAILLSLAALGECAPTPAARRGLLTALASSHLRVRLDGHTDTVRHIAWSPDGRRLATASRDGTARVFDAGSGRCDHVLRSEGPMVESVSWAPDSSRLATVGRDPVVRLWDARSGDPERLLTAPGFVGRQVAWSPRGTHVAASSKDRVVRVWEAGTGTLVHELRGHRDDVWGLSWSPDGTRLASASHDLTAILWDVAGGTPAVTLTGHTDFIEGIAWSPDGGSVATGSGDHTARIWDAATGELRLLLRGHSDYVWNVAWSPDGSMLASASSDRTVRIVSSEDAKVLAVLRGHSDTVWGVAWSPTGDRIATSSTDGTALVWDIRPRGAEQVLADGHTGPVNQASWSRDESRMVTASDDGTVRIWETVSGTPVGPPGRLDDRVWSAVWSPAADRLAVSTNSGLLRIQETSGQVLFEERAEVVEACAWSPDGASLATGGRDAVVRIRAATGAEQLALAGHQDWVGRIAWSPGGRMLASASDDRTCRLWDVVEGRQLTVLRGHDNYVDDVAWAPDEQRVVTGSGDWTAAVWDVATGRRLHVLAGHEGRVRAVGWSPDGRLLATGSDDGTVRVWSAVSFEERGIVGVHQDKVTSVAWSRDGTRLLTGSVDCTARVWPATPDYDRLEAHARGRVFRTLTDEERRRHLLPLTVS